MGDPDSADGDERPSQGSTEETSTDERAGEGESSPDAVADAGAAGPTQARGDSQTDVGTGTPERSAPEAPAEVPVDVERRIGDLDLPGSGETLKRRRETVREFYRHLRQHGDASRSDLLDLVDASEVSYSSPQSFWNDCVRDREALERLPGVEPPDEDGRAWRYLGS